MPVSPQPKAPAVGPFPEPETYGAELVPRLLSWYRASARDLPWRRTKDPYKIWVSEIMLQQTGVEVVRGYYERFLQALPTVRHLAAAEEGAVLKLWEGLGYYSRARNMMRSAKIILQRHGGRFPETYKEIRTLPGVGDYTAGAVASICFGEPRSAVDGNVLRVFSRLLARNFQTPGEKKRLADFVTALCPPRCPGDFNQSLMELGALVCTPARPNCPDCPVSSLCRAFREGRVGDFPARKRTTEKRREALTVLLLTRGEDIALRRRPAEGLLGGLWELPNAPGPLDEEEALSLAEGLGAAPKALIKSGQAFHVFSHVRWDMTWYHIDCAFGGGLSGGAVWVSRDALREDYSLPSAFSKLLNKAGLKAT